ncbi:MAG: DUF2087 domain-containing protein [Rubrivivax sp.]|nr:DUF2087 domain-containing protein [Rubrivivax sp.]MDP3225220.1 DUF2087 domain-containing protein [Rubrivivax sp.]
MTTDTSRLFEDLRPLLVKQGVSLGLLPTEEQALVFALAWSGLPEDNLTEPDVNQALKRLLQGPLVFLHTDHVELRRWLVDAQWLDRDGYGRQYRRRVAAALPGLAAAAALELDTLGVQGSAQWVASERAQHAARRTARRQAWEAQQNRVESPPPPLP